MDDHPLLWQTALLSLKQQMTSATFNTWFLNSRAVSESGDVLIVGVKSTYAKDWLESRLIDVIRREVWALATRSIGIRFEVVSDARPQPAALVLGQPDAHPAETATEAVFAGFEPYQVNFVQVPKQFFEVVLRGEAPTVVAFVAGVISETVGVIVNYHTGERREWWTATFEEIGRTCGIQSIVSVRKSVRIACSRGYVVHQKHNKAWRYRLRRFGEGIAEVGSNFDPKQ